MQFSALVTNRVFWFDVLFFCAHADLNITATNIRIATAQTWRQNRKHLIAPMSKSFLSAQLASDSDPDDEDFVGTCLY
jgi:hypothetical protein